MKKILINENQWQTRVAIIRDSDLQNVYFSSHNTKNLEKSFFKGIITKVLPGIQTAFVDIGQERSGFLHISEIDRDMAIEKMVLSDTIYSLDDDNNISENSILKKSSIDISKILKEGESILVQVSKEPIYEKGAKLTTCFTIPGRFLVLMPNIHKIGISKKIDSKEERQRLKDIISSNIPENMGAIIRTTSEFRSAEEILQDLRYLLDIWDNIQKKYNSVSPREKVYEDIELSLQVIRDHLDNDVDSVIIDNKNLHNYIYKFVKNIAPDYTYKIKYYDEPTDLFKKFDIDRQIEQALQKKVILKSGGSIIIETTEAMTVIDVNTGKYTGQTNLEDTILKTNLEAAEEITRQLRLRNIGGLIVIDFIDMNNHNNKQKLYKYFEKILKERDKFQSVVLKLSEFGLVQMTRKRSGKTLIQQLTNQCYTCNGSGFINSISNAAYGILRNLKEDLAKKKIHGNVTVKVNEDIFNFIISNEYNSILALENEYNCVITFVTLDN